MGNQISVTRSEFQKSYRSHYALYKHGDKCVSPKTRRLLLFYSVECGLKSLILKNLGKNTYEDLKFYSENNHLHIHGHDLKAMTREVGIDRKYPLDKIRLSREGGDVSPERFNELWRYGAAIVDERKEEKIETTLYEIAQWIGNRL